MAIVLGVRSKEHDPFLKSDDTDGFSQTRVGAMSNAIQVRATVPPNTDADEAPLVRGYMNAVNFHYNDILASFAVALRDTQVIDSTNGGNNRYYAELDVSETTGAMEIMVEIPLDSRRMQAFRVVTDVSNSGGTVKKQALNVGTFYLVTEAYRIKDGAGVVPDRVDVIGRNLTLTWGTAVIR